MRPPDACGRGSGEIELEEHVLVIRRIHRTSSEGCRAHRETAARVHGIFADKCPVYRSLKALRSR